MGSENKFQIFRSSAGSGKTFTLVKEYFKIILENPDRFKHTLAITFTNKSTAEMKNRILQTAQDIAQNKQNDIYDEVIKDKPELANRKSEAQQVLRNILHNYPQFSISTIDSFFSRVIRSLAYETGMPMQFQIELNNKQIIDKICSELYFDIGEDQDLKKWLIEFANHTMEQDKGWNLDRDLKNAAKELFNDKYRIIQSEKNKDDTKRIKDLHKITNTFEKTAQKIGERFMLLLDKNNLELDDFYHGKSGPARFFKYWAEKNYQEPKKRLQDFYNDNKNWPGSKTPNREIIDAISGELNGILDDAMQHHAKHFKNYITGKAIISNFYSTAVLNKLDSKYSTYRESNQVLTIGDYMNSLASLIGDEDTPFVYEKIGNRYHHLLIDEFQDTSITQWKNIKPLLINSLSDGKSSLVVGDAKQSIYRWRGSEMQLLAGEINKELKHFQPLIENKNLDTNYRSKKEVVEFNNTFFHEAKVILKQSKESEFLEKDLQLLEEVYEEHSLKQKADKKEGGYVEVKLFDSKKYPEEFNQESILLEYNVFKNQALAYALLTIQSLFKKGYDYKDICILVRTKAEINQLTQYLLNHGIKEVVSSDSLFIDDASSVALLLNSLKYLKNPDDQIAITNIIYHHFIIKNQENNYNWNNILKNEKNLEKNLDDELISKLNVLKNLPLLNLTEELCKLYGLDTISDQYALKFLDIVLSYSKKPESNLSDFLEWYETSDLQSLSNSENQNAVKIITIHSSKGLQFPVVIMPFASWPFRASNNVVTKWLNTEEKQFADLKYQSIPVQDKYLSSHFDEDIKHELALNAIDNLNILYVAFTRAEEKLFIASEKSASTRINSTCSLINAVIDSENCELETTETEIYFIGENLNKAKHKSEKEKANSLENPIPVSIKEYPLLDWENNYSLSLKDLRDKDDFGKEELRFGNQIHNKLAQVKNTNELELLIAELKTNSEIENTHYAELMDGLQHMMDTPESKFWFSDNWSVKNEKSILNTDGKLYRPDRVVYNNENCLVIDYKTGAHSKEHKKQVYEYCSFLGKMGYKKVEGFILYLSPFLVDKL